jgi:hypothetical protein
MHFTLDSNWYFFYSRREACKIWSVLLFMNG